MYPEAYKKRKDMTNERKEELKCVMACNRRVHSGSNPMVRQGGGDRTGDATEKTRGSVNSNLK